MHKLRFASALLADSWHDDVTFAIGADGLIAAISIGAGEGPLDQGAAIPGLPNVHSHAFQRAMAGLTERAGPADDSFWTWREQMYRFLDRIGPDDAEAIAALAYIDMLEGGFTVVGEFHYLHHDPAGAPYAHLAEMAERHAAAAVETGIGMTLLPVFYAHGNFGAAPPAPGQRRFLNDIDRFARLCEEAQAALKGVRQARFGIAPHSLRAAALPELGALMAAFPGGRVHMHISEQMKEVDDALAAHGRRPVELLFDHVAVDHRWCLIHATHAAEAERRMIAKAGAVVGLCPVTEANLGDGIFGALDYLEANGRFGVGTDSNVNIAGQDELRQLEYSQRLLHRRRNALGPRNASTGRTLFDAAVSGGAQALDLGPPGLQVGARADIAVLDRGHADLAGRAGDRLLDSLIFARAKGGIRDVYALGRRVVAGGRHIARERIEERYKAVLAKLLA